MSKINNEVLEIIAKSLEIKKEKVTMDSSTENLEEWDSLGHLSRYRMKIF